MTSFLLAAVHKGPYLSVQSLEEALGPDQVTYLVAGISQAERAGQGLPYLNLSQAQENWGSLEGLLHATGTKAVIRSSSEQVQEPNVEVLVAAAAKQVGVPVFVIEDFPGNYWPTPEERLDGLFIEDHSLVALHQSRGVDPSAIHTVPNPRYAALAQTNVLACRKATRRELGIGSSPVILWAGQPDGENSYLALARVLARYENPQVTLLFRAHPRDPLYTGGKYRDLLANTAMKVLDVSSHSDVMGLYCASDLVVTQFSSAGVEASHLGIPALFVLFNDLGKAYLRAYKGYDRLPWTKNDCSFIIEGEEDIATIMEQAIGDSSSRNRITQNFQRHFGAGPHGPEALVRQIRTMADLNCGSPTRVSLSPDQ
ncbi:MAG: CDP-glycerol glycerophosphotransferase family protein [Dehalococcoidia bacterium]